PRVFRPSMTSRAARMPCRSRRTEPRRTGTVSERCEFPAVDSAMLPAPLWDGEDDRTLSEIDPEHHLVHVAIGGIDVPRADQPAAICQNDFVRRKVPAIGGDLHMIEPAAFRLGESQTQRRRGIAALALPWHHGITDMPEAVVRQFRGAVLPAQAEAAAEF